MRHAATALLTTLLLTGTAQANGRLPAAGQIVVDAARPERVLLRTTFGVVLSRDHGQSWHFVCEQAMHYGRVQDPMYAFTATGHIVLGAYEGLVRSDANGEHFLRAEGPARRPIRDITVDAAGRSVYLLSARFRPTSSLVDGGDVLTYDTSLLRSDDEGQSFTLVAEDLDPPALFENLDVLPGDPQRLVMSAAEHRFGDQGFLYFSRDAGRSFTRRPLFLEKGESAPYVAAIDPRGAIYVRTGGSPDGPSRLLRVGFDTDELEVLLHFEGPMLGFALSPDGSQIWAGGPRDGLHTASTHTPRFRKLGPLAVRCLHATPTELWACADEASGFLVGVSHDGGEQFESRLRFREIHADTAATPAECTPAWNSLAADLGLTPVADPTTKGGAATPETEEPPTSTETERLVLGAAVVVALGLGIWFRRRSHPSRGSR